MRSRRAYALLAVGLIAGGVALAGPAGAARHVARGQGKVEVKIPLPPPNKAQITQVTIQVTAPNGKQAGGLTLRPINGSQVGSENVNAVAQISPPFSRRQKATFKVYVFINRGNAAARDAAGGAPSELEFALIARFIEHEDAERNLPCAGAQAHGLLGDGTSGLTAPTSTGTGGDTPHEEVKDQTGVTLCPTEAEPVDTTN